MNKTTKFSVHDRTTSDSNSTAGSGGEVSVCTVCDRFEPQAWRKTMCKNCFHSKNEHGGGKNGKEVQAGRVRGSDDGRERGRGGEADCERISGVVTRSDRIGPADSPEKKSASVERSTPTASATDTLLEESASTRSVTSARRQVGEKATSSARTEFSTTEANALVTASAHSSSTTTTNTITTRSTMTATTTTTKTASDSKTTTPSTSTSTTSSKPGTQATGGACAAPSKSSAVAAAAAALSSSTSKFGADNKKPSTGIKISSSSAGAKKLAEKFGGFRSGPKDTPEPAKPGPSKLGITPKSPAAKDTPLTTGNSNLKTTTTTTTTTTLPSAKVTTSKTTPPTIATTKTTEATSTSKKSSEDKNGGQEVKSKAPTTPTLSSSDKSLDRDKTNKKNENMTFTKLPGEKVTDKTVKSTNVDAIVSTVGGGDRTNHQPNTTDSGIKKSGGTPSTSLSDAKTRPQLKVTTGQKSLTPKTPSPSTGASTSPLSPLSPTSIKVPSSTATSSTSTSPSLSVKEKSPFSTPKTTTSNKAISTTTTTTTATTTSLATKSQGSSSTSSWVKTNSTTNTTTTPGATTSPSTPATTTTKTTATTITTSSTTKAGVAPVVASVKPPEGVVESDSTTNANKTKENTAVTLPTEKSGTDPHIKTQQKPGKTLTADSLKSVTPSQQQQQPPPKTTQQITQSSPSVEHTATTMMKSAPSSSISDKYHVQEPESPTPLTPTPKVKTMVVESSKFAKSQAAAAAAVAAAAAEAAAAAAAVTATANPSTMVEYKPGEELSENSAYPKLPSRLREEDPSTMSAYATTTTAAEVRNEGQQHYATTHSYQGANVIVRTTSIPDGDAEHSTGGYGKTVGEYSRQCSSSSTSSSSSDSKVRTPIVVEVQVRRGGRTAQQMGQPSGRSPSPAPAFMVLSPQGNNRLMRSSPSGFRSIGFPSGRTSPVVFGSSGMYGVGVNDDGGGSERGWDSGGSCYSPSPSSCSSPVSSSMRSVYRPSPSPSPTPGSGPRVIPLPVLHTTSAAMAAASGGGVGPSEYGVPPRSATVSPFTPGYTTPPPGYNTPPPPYSPTAEPVPLNAQWRGANYPAQQFTAPYPYSSSSGGGIHPNYYCTNADASLNTTAPAYNVNRNNDRAFERNNSQNADAGDGRQSEQFYVQPVPRDASYNRRKDDNDTRFVSDRAYEDPTYHSNNNYNNRNLPGVNSDANDGVLGYQQKTKQQRAGEYLRCHSDESTPDITEPAAVSRYPGREDNTVISSADAVVSSGSPAAPSAVAQPPASISNVAKEEGRSVKPAGERNRDQGPKEQKNEFPDPPGSRSDRRGSSSSAESLSPEPDRGLSSKERLNFRIQISELEDKVYKLERKNSKIQKEFGEKLALEKIIGELKNQLRSMEKKYSGLEEEKKDLEDQIQIEKVKVTKGQLESRSLMELRKLLEESDQARMKLTEENEILRDEVNEMKVEIDEMYDQFRESEAEDFRELQKELEITAKNCRILQFKLRKSERRNEQVEADREQYEEKLRTLQNAFENEDARRHIQALEEEVKMAKEVSVRLHDELDILEEKRGRVEEDNRKLQDMLELSDKKNFRMEMEIDKLRDKVTELQGSLAKAIASNDDSPNKKVKSPILNRGPLVVSLGEGLHPPPSDSTLDVNIKGTNNKVMLGQIPKQGSSETESQQLMRDLYDSLERENDLKEQMKFIEEETKNQRKKISDLEEENESLTVQMKKLMSAKTIFNKKDDGNSAAKEIELNLMLEMSERENAIARRKVAELDHMNDSLQEEVKYLEKRIEEKEQELNKVPEPSTPNAYYEDKMRELTEQCDDLKWKLIEKEREIERLSALVQNINTKQGRSLKKSRSLDSDGQAVDLNKQLTNTQQEAEVLREKMVNVEVENERLTKENRKLQLQCSRQVPSIKADDAAIENVELKEVVRRLETENKDMNIKMKAMSENLRKVSRDSLKLSIGSPLQGDNPFSPTRVIGSPAIIGSPTASRTDRIGDSASVSGKEGVSISFGTGGPAGAGAGIVGVEGVGVGDGGVLGIPAPGSSQEALEASHDRARVKQLEEEMLGKIRKITDLETCNSRMTRELNRIRAASDNVTTTAISISTNSRVAGGSGGVNSSSGGSICGAADSTVGGGSGEGDSSSEVEEGKKPSSHSESKTMDSEDRIRKELMNEIEELEDEISTQQKSLQEAEEKNYRLDIELLDMKKELSILKETFLRKEKELLTEIEMMQDKNDVLSNLLDIVNERAEDAEKELERLCKSSSSHSERSTSNVSALSDASVGSDDVFLVPPSPGGTRDKHENDDDIINKDWENQFRKRVGCLERLLAEERTKVLAAEKKLKMTGTDPILTGLVDDSKLHLREKEILQNELLENQKHMRIANDQISGLRERLQVLEEENQRLKDDYKKLESEIETGEDGAPGKGRSSPQVRSKKLQEEITHYKEEIKSLTEDCAKYKLKSEELEYKMDGFKENIEELTKQCKKYKIQAEELEYKVEELNEIWRSKSAASEKEKSSLEIRLKSKILDLRSKEDILLKLQKTVQVKSASLNEKERIIKAKEDAIFTRDEVIKELEEIAQQRDHDFDTLLAQLSSQDENVKKLRESLRQRDERLREKDDLLQKLNTSIDKKHDEVKNLDNAVRDSITRLTQKEEELKRLRTHVTAVENMRPQSETDDQKENYAMKDKFTELLQSVQRLTDDKETLCRDLSLLRNTLNDKETKWNEERNVLQSKIRTLNERLTNVTKTAMMNEKDSMRVLRQDNQNMIEEKSRLNHEIRSLREELDEKQKLLDAQADIENALEAKKKQVDELVIKSKNQLQEINKLEAQATLSFQLQQQERIRKSEQLAMKVRYETKVEKLQRDYNQLLINSERVSKEKELQQEIIKGVQRGMSNLKDKYSQEKSRWQTDKEQFEQKANEAEAGQNQVFKLKSQIEELQLEIDDRNRMLNEQSNKFATEKSTWEMERSEMQTQKNRLEARLAQVSQKSKIDAKEEENRALWEKERGEQKRLLTEAHNLAMDLQQQLKSRDDAHSKEKKQILNRLESERIGWEKKKSELEKRIAGMEECGRKLTEMQIKYQDIQETNLKDQQTWLVEKNELMRQMTEQRQRLMKDNRKIEDVLHQLSHIKTLLEESEKGGEVEVNANIVSAPSGGKRKTSKQTKTAVKEDHDIPSCWQEISFIVQNTTHDLHRYMETRDKEVQSQIRRSLSSTQLELNKELESILGADAAAGLLLSVPGSEGGGITRSRTTEGLQAMTITNSSNEYLSANVGSHISRSPSPSLFVPRGRASRDKSPSRSPTRLQPTTSKTLIKSISVDTPEAIYTVSTSSKRDHSPARRVPSPTTSTVSLNVASASTATLPRMSSHKGYVVPTESLKKSPSLPVPTRTQSTESVTPITARRQFFDKPGFGMSWPRAPKIGHTRQSSMPESTFMEVKQEGNKSVDFKSMVSLNEQSKTTESKPVKTQTENTAKDKRRLFKKSSSVDSPVISSLAKASVQAQPAAPSMMRPSDIFKAVKQKLRPAFKKTRSFDSSSVKEGDDMTTTVPSEGAESPGATPSSTWPETPDSTQEIVPSAFQPVMIPNLESEPERGHRHRLSRTEEQQTARFSESTTGDKRKAFKKFRSKSADTRSVHEDRIRSGIVHADIISPVKVWEFNETPV